MPKLWWLVLYDEEADDSKPKISVVTRADGLLALLRHAAPPGGWSCSAGVEEKPDGTIVVKNDPDARGPRWAAGLAPSRKAAESMLKTFEED